MIYIVLLLCHNEIHYSEPFSSLTNAEDKAISLANEWHNKDGIAKHGKYRLETIEEIQDYYRSDAYFDSGDDVHVVTKHVVLL